MSRLKAVITDMDGTLYSWVDYVVPAFDAMVRSLVETTGIEEARIVEALKEVYTRRGTNEYAFAIQESKIFEWSGLPFDRFNREVITPARQAFSECRRRYLHPYRGVRSTLEALRAAGVRLVALTDAPRFPAERRLKQLDLDAHFDALYALAGFPLPDLVDAEARARAEQGAYRSALPLVVELPVTYEKPSPEGMRRVLSDLGLDPEQVLVVGDNLKKDIAAAAAAGLTAAWAEYGTYIAPAYRERLEAISAPGVARKNVAEEGEHAIYRPAATLSNFRQVLDLVARGV